MRHRFRNVMAIALTLSASLVGPLSAQQSALSSATPQQKDAWGEDIVRYCAAEIQAYKRAEPKGFNKVSEDVATALKAALSEKWGVLHPVVGMEYTMRNAATIRKEYERRVKEGASASSLASYRWQMAEHDARACIAGRAMHLLTGDR